LHRRLFHAESSARGPLAELTDIASFVYAAAAIGIRPAASIRKA
jgi:hypothetical protein